MKLFFLIFICALLKSSYSAIAKFSIENTGITGWVVANDRHLSVFLNVTAVNYSKLPSTSCFSSGLHFHIHEQWNTSSQNDRIGSTACGASITGDHWDPYLACGPKSANGYCKTHTKGCVNSSSTFDSKDVYACNTSNYAVDPYVCEVADWSGKYGTLLVTNNISKLNTSSFWEVESADLAGKSVVFHCASNDARAFCAPFESTTNGVETSMNQTTTESYLAAVFLNNDVVTGYFSFWADGAYAGGFNTYNFASTCSSGYKYRIYDSWSSNQLSLVGNSACKNVVGSVWDPTVTCLHGSDSKFCQYPNYDLCNFTSYSYSCDPSSRYSCSPSDLSGKYGSISSQYQVFFVSSTDDIFAPLSQINGKSLVVECADYSSIVACAKITDYPLLTFNITQAVEKYQSTSTKSEGSFQQFSFTIVGAVGMLWFFMI